MKHVLTSLAALAFCAFGVGAVAAPAESAGPAGMERMQHWAADHEAMLDAKLAGLKAGLKLTSDQEKLWAPFEAAVRDAWARPARRIRRSIGWRRWPSTCRSGALPC